MVMMLVLMGMMSGIGGIVVPFIRIRFEHEENCQVVGDFVLDKSSPDYRRDSFEDFEEDGRVVWFERVKRKFGSRSYE